jgi:hypothetical protein
VAGKRLTKADIKEHRKRHIRLGHMEGDFEFIPQQVEPLLVQSVTPLYLLILQHNSLDLTERDQGYEFLDGIPNDNKDLHFEDAHIDNASNASESGEEEQDELPEEEQELCAIGSGIFSEEHRLRILEHNTARWGM